MTGIRTFDARNIGRREWISTVTAHRWDGRHGAEPQQAIVARHVSLTRVAAERWLLERMSFEGKRTQWELTGGIRTGVWEAKDYDDVAVGLVHDAWFEEDDLPSAYADVGPDGPVIEWSES